jgi:hypothetical protein
MKEIPPRPGQSARDHIGCEQRIPAQAAEVVGQTFTAMADSCAYCHGAKYTDTLRQWKEDLAKLEVRIVELGVHAQQHVSEANVSAAVRRRAELLLADAEYNCRFVTLGHGVHNFNYSLALLNAAGDFYRRAEATIDAEPSAVAPATEPVREPSD